ncbi:MAG: Bax inhibitor-1/YccA family protein [Micrococcales bacterium]|nr:Bax inhibitor-1/YccA family protein [Micrococcales bacterium]
MSNPVFDRINDGIRKGGYASFEPRGRQAGRGRGQQQGQPQYGQYSSTPQDLDPRSLDDLYNQPSAGPVQMGRLTVDDVVMKALGLFGLLLVTAGITGFVIPVSAAATLILPAILVTLVLGLVISFKKTVSVPLIVGYAALEGVLVGGVSRIYGSAFGSGVVTTAIVATLSVFIAMFAGWKLGFIKVTDKSRRIFGLAIFGYMIFALANFVAAWAFGANSGWGFFGFGSGLSILVSVVAVGLASYSLAMDFDSIDRAVAAQLPQKYSWLLAHGLIVTVVWLYLEILRLVAQLQGRN